MTGDRWGKRCKNRGRRASTVLLGSIGGELDNHFFGSNPGGRIASEEKKKDVSRYVENVGKSMPSGKAFGKSSPINKEVKKGVGMEQFGKVGVKKVQWEKDGWVWLVENGQCEIKW